MTTREAIILLADSIAAQTLAICSTSDAVCALRDTLLFHHPEMTDDYASRLDAAQKQRQQQTDRTQQMLSQLHELAAQLSD